jgi:hypothetical protein
MVTAVFLSNDVWTFWDVMFLFFIWIPLVMIWFFAIFDVFARRDLTGWSKALWLLAIIIIPWFGTLVYLLVRPREAPADTMYAPQSYAAVPQATTAAPAGGQGTEVDQLQSLAALHSSGAITDAEFATMKARVTGSPQAPVA